ncbi:MAG: DUF7010 family protein [Burkholderiaceae bacterium]
MSKVTFGHAQENMRYAYFSGAAGVLISGCVWLAAGLVAALNSASVAVLVLLVGGALIHPASVVLCKLLGRTGSHEPDNPLGILAIEGTFWLLAGIAIAYGVHLLRVEWFFPAMLLVIGGRYLTFQSIYGLRIYWLCGVALCLVGLALAIIKAPPSVSALSGAAIELIFATLVFAQARRRVAA